MRSWLTTRDHKRIGLMFLGATLLAMLLGGVFALLIRIEHLTPHHTIMRAETYNRLFTLHGVVMVWLFMIPVIPSGLGNFLLPLMLGARDVAFPRLNLLSFYIYLAGAALTLGAMLWGGADTGWTFYTPYSATSPSAVTPVVLGVFVLGISSIMGGINFIVTVHALRARGLGWFAMPLFAWSIYATSIIQVLATPVLGLSLALVALDHAGGWGIFDPARGGDPLLYQHLFWFYSHPAVYIMILPAMGVISEVVCTFSRKAPSSYKAIAFSSLGIALVGFLTWGHHLFVAGQSAYAAGAFGVALRARGDLLGDQGLRLARHHAPRLHQLRHAAGLRLHLPVPVRVRRHDRRGAGDHVARRALARHLLHRRALPLHHGRRHA